MNQRRKTIYWVIAMFSLAMLPQLVLMPAPVLFLPILPLLWRLAAEARDWKPLPAVMRHSITALAIIILFVSYGDMSGRRAAVSLLTVMLALKMVECYEVRDARLVVSFSLFLCATQYLFAQGILMPFYGAGTIILALAALTQLHREEAWAFAGPTPSIKASIFSELGFSFRLLALAVPVGLAFFMLFPRLSSPLWGIPETTLDAKSGLSDTMSPGSIQQLFLDDSPAFRVQFDGATPTVDELYWRGPVLWRFDGDSWGGSFYGSNIPAATVESTRGRQWNYTVQLEPNERKWLFALDYPLAPPEDSRLSMDFQILRQDPVIQLLDYSVTSRPDFIDMPELTQTIREEALYIPQGSNPRTREWVERQRLETPRDMDFARRVLDHFNQQPFYYSLESPLLGTHPVDEFLFDSRVGYCEHYASAFAVMMRMADIPARIVTGYQGGWYNEFGNYLLVRQSDAHAWAEIWLPGQGWSRVDPTAAVSPLRIKQGSLGALSSPRHFLDYSWLRQVRNRADIVQQRWNNWIIEYGARRQARLLEPLGMGNLTPAQLVIALFVVIGLFGAVLFPLVLRIKGPGNKDPIQKLWQKFLKRLKSEGFETLPSTGALELAESASAAFPRDSGAICRIAVIYTNCRYSPRPPAVYDLKRAVNEFRPKKKAV